MHSIIVIFLIKASSRSAIRKKMCKLVGVAATSCFERRLQNVLSNVTYSPNHRQASAPLINIQSTLRSASNLCKNVSLKVLFGNNGNSYTVSTQSDMCLCIYTYILRNTEMLVSECSVLRNSFQMPFWEHVPKVRQSLSRPKEMPTQPPV